MCRPSHCADQRWNVPHVESRRPCANSSVCVTFTRARCGRSTMSGRFVLLARDFESCQTQDTCAAQLTHARLQQQGSRSVSSCCVSVTQPTHVSHVLAHVSHSVRAASSSWYLAAVSSFCWLVEHFSADATPSVEDLS